MYVGEGQLRTEFIEGYCIPYTWCSRPLLTAWCRFEEPNFDLLQKQYVFLVTEASPQPVFVFQSALLRDW